MKRTLTVLAAFLAAAALAACGDSAVSSNTANTDAVADTNAADDAAETEAVGSSLDSLGEKDFGGLTYTILDANTHIDLHTNIPGDALNGEVVNDALINRDNYLENRYNIDIVYQQTDSATVLKKSVMAGDNEYDFVITEIYGGMVDLASNGVLYNLCDLPYVEPDKEWWSPLMYESLRLNGAMYYTSSDIAPAVYQSACCMFMNLKLYNDYDVESMMGEDIYQMVIEGKWTLGVLDTVTKDLDVDVNGDSKWTAEDDFYGLVMQSTDEASDAFVLGAGYTLCQLNDDDTNITYNIDDQGLYTAVDEIASLARKISYDDINDVINLTFKEDRALFLQHKLESAAVHLRDMESDYLILPMPKADESQEHYYSFVSGYVSGFSAVPKSVDPETNGFITEALARYSHEYLRPIAFDIVYKQKDSRDERTVEVLDILFDNLFIDFYSVYNFGSAASSLTNTIFNDKPLASALEKKRSSAEKQIAKLVAWWGVED